MGQGCLLGQAGDELAAVGDGGAGVFDVVADGLVSAAEVLGEERFGDGKEGHVSGCVGNEPAKLMVIQLKDDKYLAARPGDLES